MLDRARWLPLAAAILLALMSSLVPLRPAQADCSVDDFGNALSDAYNQAPPISCLAQYDNPYFYVLLAGLGIPSSMVKSGDPNPVKDACDAVKNATAQAAAVQSKLTDLWSKIPQEYQDQLKDIPIFKSIKDEAGTYLSDLSDAAATMTCACDFIFDHGISELTNAVGDCAKAALCAANDWAHDNISADFSSCKDTLPPINVIDCANVYKNTDDPNNPYLANTLDPTNGLGVYYCPDDQGNLSACLTCSGGICTSRNGDGARTSICYCPSPMVMTISHANTQEVNTLGFPDYASCDCPKGTTSAGSGPLARVCLCNNGGLPMDASGNCPSPKPPKKPTTPPQPPACAVAGTVKIADGTCCAPTQVTACGICCPAGQKPDATGGSCISAQAAKPKPKPRLSPRRPG